MQTVKIKNINKSYMKKPFIVKGRIKYINVESNRNSSGTHLNAIIFDDSSEIEVVAFKNCEKIAKLLQKNNVVTIENGILREVNKDYKKTKHKYQIILESVSLITIINNDEVNNVEFPQHKYTSGAELKTLKTGMIIDVIGVCQHLDNEKTVNGQNQTIRKGKIFVDSILIDVRFFGDKVDELYNVCSTLYLTSVKYVNYNGFIHLLVGDSSSVQCNTQQLSNGMDTKQLHQLEKVKKFCQDFTVEFPEQRLSTSSITQPNKNSTIELPDRRLSTSSITQSNKSLTIELSEPKPSTSSINQSFRNLVDESIDQIPSTSGSTPSNKRKPLKGEEVPSKILKKTEPDADESFSDERFVNMVINFMQSVKDNKNVVQLRILEFISNMLKENEK